MHVPSEQLHFIFSCQYETFFINRICNERVVTLVTSQTIITGILRFKFYTTIIRRISRTDFGFNLFHKTTGIEDTITRPWLLQITLNFNVISSPWFCEY